MICKFPSLSFLKLLEEDAVVNIFRNVLSHARKDFHLIVSACVICIDSLKHCFCLATHALLMRYSLENFLNLSNRIDLKEMRYSFFNACVKNASNSPWHDFSVLCLQ